MSVALPASQRGVTRRLIVNADDFGLTDGVCSGILHAMEHGAVTSTSAMVCDPEARHRLAAFRDKLSGRCGVHLQATDGQPLTGAPAFPRFPAQIGPVDPDALAREWRTQIAAFRDCGLAPTHLDTHHHVHSIPAIFDVYCEIARECSLPVRTLDSAMTRELRARGLSSPSLGADLNAGPLAAAAGALFDAIGGAGTVEIVCHPAYVDQELTRRSVYTQQRAVELEMLCAPELKRTLAAMGIELIPYSP